MDSSPRLIAAAARVILRVTKRSGRRGDSWLKRIPQEACRSKRSRYMRVRKSAIALPAPYGVIGAIGVDSSCGACSGRPKTSAEAAWKKRIERSTLTIASRKAAVDVAAIATVGVGCSHDSGTKVAPARWKTQSGRCCSTIETTDAASQSSASTISTESATAARFGWAPFEPGRSTPSTLTPSPMRYSARYEPSWPAIPVMRAVRRATAP